MRGETKWKTVKFEKKKKTRIVEEKKRRKEMKRKAKIERENQKNKLMIKKNKKKSRHIFLNMIKMKGKKLHKQVTSRKCSAVNFESLNRLSLFLL